MDSHFTGIAISAAVVRAGGVARFELARSVHHSGCQRLSRIARMVLRYGGRNRCRAADDYNVHFARQ